MTTPFFLLLLKTQQKLCSSMKVKEEKSRKNLVRLTDLEKSSKI